MINGKPFPLQGEEIVCFAGEDWWYHNPHSNFHLMKEFALYNRVLFVNSIGVRAPSLTQGGFFWKRVTYKLRSLARYLRCAQPNIYVLTPIALPLFSWGGSIIRRVNKWLLIIQLVAIMRYLGFARPIFWVTLPTARDAVLSLRCFAKALVYYCVDNVSFYHGADHDEIFRQDTDLQRAADLALFVSHELLEERCSLNPNTRYLNHGVDADHFASAQSQSLPIPDEMQKIRKPIAGYLGSIADLDLKLIRYLAHTNPDVSFVFIGEGYTDVSILREFDNVHFLGRRPYERLPAYTKAFDCCCLLYQTGDPFNDYRNPKKLLEYLATGKPVVSVYLRELVRFQDCVLLADTPNHYSQQLRRALKNDTDDERRRRMDVARQHTWHASATRAAGLIASVVASVMEPSLNTHSQDDNFVHVKTYAKTHVS